MTRQPGFYWVRWPSDMNEIMFYDGYEPLFWDGYNWQDELKRGIPPEIDERRIERGRVD